MDPNSIDWSKVIWSSFNGSIGITTTPDQRTSWLEPPYTYPALQVNLFFRVFLGLVSMIVIWAPMKLLWKHGEFAATVFCASTTVINLFYTINALIWHDNNVQEWWAGYGWCDLQSYTSWPLHTIYNICIFEIMRGLADKVGVLRVSSLTASERRRKVLISAAIIFIIPFYQLILFYFIVVGRYNISALVGCTNYYDPDWLFFVSYQIPTPVFIIAAAFMAVLVWFRFRQIEKMTRGVVFSDDVMVVRRQRVRRKLYLMSLMILVVVLPVVLYLWSVNIRFFAPVMMPYDFNRIHYEPPWTYNFITFTTSNILSPLDLNTNWIPNLTSIAIFVTFGTTADSFNEYRKMMLAVGLGRFFPKLHNEYQDSDKPSWFSTVFRSSARRSRNRTGNSSGSKDTSILPVTQQSSNASSAGKEGGQDLVFVTAPVTPPAPAVTKDNNPSPDLSEEPAAPTATQQQQPSRNPWVFRTTLASPLKMPTIPMTGLGRKKPSETAAAEQRMVTPTSATPLNTPIVPRSAAPSEQRNPGGDGDVGAAHDSDWDGSPRPWKAYPQKPAGGQRGKDEDYDVEAGGSLGQGSSSSNGKDETSGVVARSM
ncbi:pheromone A receptor-domain-containing protein [Diplogelasinospora grovesii]|uniref:Pheromone A receptor-domain-containing protein n=1 Tax=Diplogelasinospora grovesii TaxID=303347 RepID=A0AAN6S8T5_9PEZI|nr:pheromone A receptor-domain-containing protein [Diplogelasinospora grovesii]